MNNRKTSLTQNGRAAVIARRQSSGAIMEAMLQPENKYQREWQSKGVAPKDHMKKNLIMLRQQQEQNKLTSQDKETKPQQQFKSRKYESIKSTLSGGFDANQSRTRRANSLEAEDTFNNGQLRHSSTGVNVQKTEKHNSFGKVPKYLQDMQKNMKEQEAIKQQMKEQAKIPAGSRLLTQTERDEIAHAISRKKEELEALHHKLPLKIETDGQNRRFLALVEQQKQAEAATKTFSRSPIYVPIDATTQSLLAPYFVT